MLKISQVKRPMFNMMIALGLILVALLASMGNVSAEGPDEDKVEFSEDGKVLGELTDAQLEELDPETLTDEQIEAILDTLSQGNLDKLSEVNDSNSRVTRATRANRSHIKGSAYTTRGSYTVALWKWSWGWKRQYSRHFSYSPAYYHFYDLSPGVYRLRITSSGRGWENCTRNIWLTGRNTKWVNCYD